MLSNKPFVLSCHLPVLDSLSSKNNWWKHTTNNHDTMWNFKGVSLSFRNNGLETIELDMVGHIHNYSIWKTEKQIVILKLTRDISFDPDKLGEGEKV